MRIYNNRVPSNITIPPQDQNQGDAFENTLGSEPAAGEVIRLAASRSFVLMVRLPEFAPIEFLIARKFPSPMWAALSSARAQTKQPGLKFSPADHARREKEIDEYRAKLEALPANELQSLVESETAKVNAERAAELQREEDARFFNQPRATADFEHWSKAAYWTLEEAIALAMGKAPESVSWMTIRKYQ